MGGMVWVGSSIRMQVSGGDRSNQKGTSIVSVQGEAPDSKLRDSKIVRTLFKYLI